jgi:hypothetical protein
MSAMLHRQQGWLLHQNFTMVVIVAQERADRWVHHPSHKFSMAGYSSVGACHAGDKIFFNKSCLLN